MIVFQPIDPSAPTNTFDCAKHGSSLLQSKSYFHREAQNLASYELHWNFVN